jgi:hypothetical protein
MPNKQTERGYCLFEKRYTAFRFWNIYALPDDAIPAIPFSLQEISRHAGFARQWVIFTFQ